MLDAEDVQSDILDLLKDHFSTGRTLPRMSQAALTYSRDEENAGTLKIRPSEIVTQNDTSDDIPIIAVSYDDQKEQVLGFNRGMVSDDMDTATTIHASFMYVPVYINAISSNKIESYKLANYIRDMIQGPLRFVLLEKTGYHDMLFQSPGNPTIIRYIGPSQTTYATPLAGTVTLERVHSVTEKAKTLTQVSAYMNEQKIWNGGPTDE